MNMRWNACMALLFGLGLWGLVTIRAVFVDIIDATEQFQSVFGLLVDSTLTYDPQLTQKLAIISGGQRIEALASPRATDVHKLGLSLSGIYLLVITLPLLAVLYSKNRSV